MVEDVEAAIAELRAGLQTDGADLELEEVGSETVRLTLSMSAEAECSACILPKPALARIVQASLARHGIDGKTVELIDPRDG